MKLKSLLISSMLLLSVNAYAVTDTESSSQQSNTEVLSTPDEIRQLISQNKFKDAKDKLVQVKKLYDEKKIDNSGIFLTLEANVAYQDLMNDYTSILDELNKPVSDFEKASAILDKLNNNMFFDRYEKLKEQLTLVSTVLTTDKKIAEKAKELALHPELDSKLVKNTEIPLVPDMVAVKLEEAKIYKIAQLTSDIQLMTKTMANNYTHLKSIQKYYQNIHDKAMSQIYSKIVRGAGALALIGTIGGLVFVIGRRQYAIYVKNKLYKDTALKMNAQMQTISDKMMKVKSKITADAYKELEDQLAILTSVKELIEFETKLDIKFQ